MVDRKLKSNNLKIIVGLFVVAVSIVVGVYNTLTKSGLKVVSWNNYYNENNIVFFYEDSVNEKINKLNAKYKVKEYVSDETSEFEKVLKITDLVKSVCEKDGVQATGLKDGYDILEQKEGAKKVSFKDMAVISRDMISTLGLKARIGIFRSSESQNQSDYEYYVVEYWSTEYNKWIMIDFTDKGYFEDGDSKLSAIEVLNCNLRKIPYMGNTPQKDYKNNLNKYLDSYSVSIENSSMKTRSNCNVTYIKDKGALTLKYRNSYTEPTIFTEETKLFEKSPFNSAVSHDEKAYIIACISDITEGEDKDNAPSEKKKIIGRKAVISAFQDDAVLKSYYISIDGGQFEKVDGSKEIELKNGNTSINISLDGVNTVSSITLNNY